MKKTLPLFLFLSLLAFFFLMGWSYHRPATPLKNFYQQHFEPKSGLLHQLFSTAPAASGGSSGPAFTAQLPLRSYTVKPGDTLWDLAKKFNLNIDTVVSFNPALRVHVIKPGEVIRLPALDGLLVQAEAPLTTAEAAARYQLSAAQQAKLFFFTGGGKHSQLFLPGVNFNLEERMEFLGAEFLKPLEEIRITSLYGMRLHPLTKRRAFHRGVDLGALVGTPVYAGKGGVVIFAGRQTRYGFIVIIKHAKGYVSKYAHLSAISVQRGKRVAVSQQIGRVGNTGASTGPHLHFEIWKHGKPINPRDVTQLH